MFAVAAALAIGYVYWYTSVYYIRQLDSTIQAELRGLGEQYRVGGLPQLREVVAQRSQRPSGALYLIATKSGQPVAGNFTASTSALLETPGRRTRFRYQPRASGPDTTRLAYGQTVRLPNDYRLFVGRDIQEWRQLEQIFAWASLWGIGVIAVIGVFGGLLVSRVLLRRIGSITDTSQRIMHGDLSQRVPLTGTGDELDRLAENLNAMLDRIERLVDGLREVSDNIAHDLKTPLTRMRNRIDTALRETEGSAAYRETLIQTVEDADELIRTFNALLSIARLEAGVQVEDFAQFDLAALAGDAVELYEPLAESEGIAISLAAPEPTPVAGNRQLLAQATANLIDNAIKYARPTSGTEAAIRVSVARGEGCIRLTVADNGPGIPEHQRQHALNRFARLETSRSRPGSGLGLSLVAAVARVHDGTITLHDNEPGLRVVISLPAPRPQAGKAPK